MKPFGFSLWDFIERWNRLLHLVHSDLPSPPPKRGKKENGAKYLGTVWILFLGFVISSTFIGFCVDRACKQLVITIIKYLWWIQKNTCLFCCRFSWAYKISLSLSLSREASCWLITQICPCKSVRCVRFFCLFLLFYSSPETVFHIVISVSF